MKTKRNGHLPPDKSAALDANILMLCDVRDAMGGTARMRLVSSILGREVATLTELSMYDANKVIAGLMSMPTKASGGPHA